MAGNSPGLAQHQVDLAGGEHHPGGLLQHGDLGLHLLLLLALLVTELTEVNSGVIPVDIPDLQDGGGAVPGDLGPGLQQSDLLYWSVSLPPGVSDPPQAGLTAAPQSDRLAGPDHGVLGRLPHDDLPLVHHGQLDRVGAELVLGQTAVVPQAAGPHRADH